MFVYGIGIQYGRQFFDGFTGSLGLKLNGLSLFSHLVALGVCYVAYALFSVSAAYVAGLFAGALTSTPALYAAISAAGSDDPALGYSVAYPFGLIGPILCMYFANVWLKPKLPDSIGTGLEILEIVVRNPEVTGRPLADLATALPAGVQIVVVRTGHQNRVPAPEIVLNQDDVIAVVSESMEALEKAKAFIGESAIGRITKDRQRLDYFGIFVSRGAVTGVRLADLRMRGVSEFSVVHVRRGDADLLPRPELALEFGDRVGIMARRGEIAALRHHFGDSIKGTTEISYVSLGVGMALGILLGTGYAGGVQQNMSYVPECYIASTAIRERRRTLRYCNLLVCQIVEIKNKIRVLPDARVRYTKKCLHKADDVPRSDTRQNSQGSWCSTFCILSSEWLACRAFLHSFFPNFMRDNHFRPAQHLHNHTWHIPLSSRRA